MRYNTLIPKLYGDAIRFLDYCQSNLGILPLNGYFAVEFTAIARDYPKQAIPAEQSQLPLKNAGVYHDLKIAIEARQKERG